MHTSLNDEDLGAQDVCHPTDELEAQPFETPFFTLQKGSVDLTEINACAEAASLKVCQ